MAIDILRERGTPLDKQRLSWREMVGQPISKLDNDAFTRLRVILMNGVEQHMNRFLHALSWMRADLRGAAAHVRRIDHHQQTAINWLLGADHDLLETTIAFEQAAIEVTAAVAQAEPDPYLAQVHRFGLLEDFDHLYRFSALMDRLQGKDANSILQSYTDVMPGRATIVQHRSPADDLRIPYDREDADPLSKLHAITILAGKNQTRDYYMTIGPTFSDPLARQLYAEIASIEEQHVTQYESIASPEESWLEKWVLHELCEVYNYYSCASAEGDPRVRGIWERFLDYELGQLHFVMDLFRQVERRDPAEIVPATLPPPLAYTSQRAFVRETLASEVGYRSIGPTIGEVPDSGATVAYRRAVHRDGVPSEIVASGYRFVAGTELLTATHGDSSDAIEVHS